MTIVLQGDVVTPRPSNGTSIAAMSSSDDQLVRRDAIYDALRRRLPDLFDRLMEALLDPDPTIRSTAAYAFSDFIDSRSVPLLFNLIRSDPDKDVIHNAVLTLGSYTGQNVRNFLLV